MRAKPKAIAWQYWVDLDKGWVIVWHPSDASPGGNCVQITKANHQELMDRRYAERLASCEYVARIHS